MSRIPVPQRTFADLEFFRQGIDLEPTLQRIAVFLDTHGTLVDQVHRDLVRGLKQATTGRTGVTASQVLRSLILMRVKNWDYRELRERIADGYTLRHFTDFDSQAVPKHDAFNRAFNRVTPATMEVINAAVIQAAVSVGLEDGTKLRVDTTVVETDIHHPTDSTLLGDAVRVLTRLVRQLHDVAPAGVGAFTNRTRSARRRMRELQRMTAMERHTQQGPTYRALIRITEQVVADARAVIARVRVPTGPRRARTSATTICHEIRSYCALADRVIDQTRRRVLQGEQVPADEKVYSIFEPHTDLIKRGKERTPIEFGHKVFLAESGHGLITQYRVLTGNPADGDQVAPSLESHVDVFGHAPDLYSGDRGFFSAANLDACHAAGVTCACIPQAGGKRNAAREALEKSRPFKQGQRFRAGIEGRISVLFRGRGMKRALVEGRAHFEVLVGAAVLANNLLVIAELQRARHARRRRAA